MSEGGREEKESDRKRDSVERAKTTTVKSRTGLKKNSFRRKWETKERTWRPHGCFKELLHLSH